MSFGLWFSLDVEHGYYADARCRGLELRLDPASAKILAGHRGLARARPGGIDILAELDADGQRPLVSPAPALRLGFELLIRDSELPLFTEMTQLRALAAPTFTISATGEVALGEGEARLASNLLARVNVVDIDASWLAAPPRHRVVLSPRSLRWIYYYVAPVDAAKTTVAISDDEPERAKAKIVFNSEAAKAGADDRIADELAKTYPNQQRFRLISREPLACSATARRRLSLRDHGSTLVDELPNPNLTTVSRPTLDGVTQDVLHYILIR